MWNKNETNLTQVHIVLFPLNLLFINYIFNIQGFFLGKMAHKKYKEITEKPKEISSKTSSLPIPCATLLQPRVSHVQPNPLAASHM